MMNEPEKKQESMIEIAQTAAAEAVPVEEAAPAQGTPFVSKGQKFHKWTTYLGIDWILNATFGVSFSYWGKYSEMGRKKWSEPLTEFLTRKLAPHIKDPVSLEKSVEKGNMFMSIIAGGMMTIPPLMVMESRRVKKTLSRKYDNFFYGKEVVASDPKFQESYDRIDDEPRKSFTTGMISRFIALAPLLAMVLHEKTREVTDKIYFSPVSAGSDKTARAIGFSPQSFKNISEAEAKERWKFIHDNVAMDAGLSLPYAGMHAVTYGAVAGFFSRMFGKKKYKAEPENIRKALPAGIGFSGVPAGYSAGFAEKQESPLSLHSHAARELARKTEAETASPTLG